MRDGSMIVELTRTYVIITSFTVYIMYTQIDKTCKHLPYLKQAPCINEVSRSSYTLYTKLLNKLKKKKNLNK